MSQRRLYLILRGLLALSRFKSEIIPIMYGSAAIYSTSIGNGGGSNLNRRLRDALISGSSKCVTLI